MHNARLSKKKHQSSRPTISALTHIELAPFLPELLIYNKSFAHWSSLLNADQINTQIWKKIIE